MTRNYFKVKTIDSLSLAGASSTEGFCVEPSMKGPSFVYFFLILTNCNQMSQFNSIFSPLTNKLARLAGITLLAVAALFASTQNIAAQGSQTCVTSLEVRVGDNCQATVTVGMVMLGTVVGTPDVRINDLNPTNGGIVDGVSPASGWAYGVYASSAASAALICQGVIFAVDYTAPAVVDPADHNQLTCDDIANVLNVEASWKTATNAYFTGALTSVTDNCGGLVQVKVTDRIVYDECNSGGVMATITRTFQAIDQRGNDTTVTQLITFNRPSKTALAVHTSSTRTAKTTINGLAVYSTNGTVGGGVYVATPGTVTTPNMVVFNKCTGIPSTKDDLRAYLQSIYTYKYGNSISTGTGFTTGADSLSFFNTGLNALCNYSSDFTYTVFPTCNGTKFAITASVVDWCNSANNFTDYWVLAFEDRSAPVFAANSTVPGAGTAILGTSSGSPVVVSVGTNDCTASLRLGTAANLRDLSNLFNLKVTDVCSGTAISLKYDFETGAYWNASYYVPAPTSGGGYAPANYTVVNLGTPTAPIYNVIGLPIGDHKVTITAHDGCNNQNTQVLYFKVVDNVAPVMKCDDVINVSLTSNSSSNWYQMLNAGDADVTQQMSARLTVADINEGSRDNCTLDSLYVRRQFTYTDANSGIFRYLKLNTDYDAYSFLGTSNGVVTIADFEPVLDGSGAAVANTYWTPRHMQYVDVFCSDRTDLMVELWGTDAKHYNNSLGSNWSSCMSTINIVDKTEPVITAPNLDKTYNALAKNWVNCTEKEIIGTSSITDGRIANETLSNAMFGFPDIYGLECNGSVKYEVTKALTCDTGTITRKWTVTKGSIVKSVTQTIYVRANHDFSITVPVDVAGDCAATVGSNLGLDEAGCDLLAVSYSETKYDAAPGDNFCYKIYRTGTVINWCMVPNHMSCAAADPAAYAVTIPRNTGSAAVKYTFTLGSANAGRSQTALEASTAGSSVLVKGGAIAAAGENIAGSGASSTSGFVTPTLPSCVTKPGFAYKYTQVIKVTDNTKPTVASGTAWTPATADADKTAGISWNATKNSFSIDGATCKAKFKLSFAASDACATNDLELEKIELLDRGLDILTATGTSVTGTITGTTNGLFTISGSGLPVDEYDVRVTVRDDCGNVTVSRLAVDVEDNKAPAPVCVQNLTATLMPAGGTAPKCMVVVNAKDVFQDIDRDWSKEDCSGGVVASIAKLTNGVEGTRAATLTLTEADKGGVTARVYLKDAAGNEDFCTVTINVEDNFCGNGTASAAVAGAIQTESKATVEGVQVNLSGQTQKSFATGVNGLFIFNNLTAGADYTVTPSLNKGFLNGVSTFDLVLISKHILGVQPLNTPYKLIAADVNNSKSVTTLDLIQLRKLILNIDATFANNSSWRFVDASYTFPNASNPWAASFPEVKNVNDLEGSLSANFVAVKVGDVNGNAIANSTQGSVRNLTSNLGINVADMNLVAGNEYKVDFTAADLNGIEGFQFTLNLDKKGLELVDLVPGIAAEENFGIFAEEGVVTASWNGEAKGGVLFSLVVRAKSNTTLSEVLNLNSRYTAAEAYKGGEVVNVGLNFNASKASANYELYQNTPNPFAGESIIGFNLPAAGAATLTIQDVTGRTLKVINGQYAKGYNQVSLKSTELSATGVLTYTLKAADFTATRKMIIVE